jgi:uncharacterized membrane protein (UPF0136 family)
MLRAYRYVFAALIVTGSVEAFGTHEHAAAILAVMEVAGALLLMWRKTQIVGAGLLLAVFAFAQALSAASGQWPVHFAQYAAATLLIVLLDRALVAAR